MTSEELIKDLNDSCFKMADAAVLYADDILARADEFKKQVTYYEYGIAGTNLHRGWYSPSLIEDIVIGNASRGRLVRNPRKSTKPSFRFGFDQNEKIIVVDGYVYRYDECRHTDSEYIVYEEDTIKGFTFLTENEQFATTGKELVRYSEEKYHNGLLVLFSYIDFSRFERKPWKFHLETHSVNDLKMHSNLLEYEPADKYYSNLICDFDIDENGFLTAYSCHDEGSAYYNNYTVTKPRSIRMPRGTVEIEL